MKSAEKVLSGRDRLIAAMCLIKLAGGPEPGRAKGFILFTIANVSFLQAPRNWPLPAFTEGGHCENPLLCVWVCMIRVSGTRCATTRGNRL